MLIEVLSLSPLCGVHGGVGRLKPFTELSWASKVILGFPEWARILSSFNEPKNDGFFPTRYLYRLSSLDSENVAR